jgi:hypothetical protein
LERGFTRLDDKYRSREIPPAGIEELLASGKHEVLRETLNRLAERETDGRCGQYLEAGKKAWLAGEKSLACELWRLGLQCRPTKPFELPIRGDRVLRSLKPAAFFSDPRENDAFRLPDEPSDDALERTFLSHLIRTLGLPEPELLLLENGTALMLQRSEETAMFAEAFHALESFNTSETFQVKARLILAEPSKLRAAESALFRKKKSGFPVSYGLMYRILRNPATKVFPLPSISLTPYALTRRLNVEEIPYVRDYDVSIVCSSADRAFPILGRLYEGLVLAFRAVRLPDRQLFCQARIALAQVPKPIPRFHTTLGAGKDSRPVAIDIPEILTSGGTFHFHPAEGATFLVPLGGLVEGEGMGKRRVALTVTVTR